MWQSLSDIRCRVESWKCSSECLPSLHEVQGHPWLHSEFETSWGCKGRCLENYETGWWLSSPCCSEHWSGLREKRGVLALQTLRSEGAETHRWSLSVWNSEKPWERGSAETWRFGFDHANPWAAHRSPTTATLTQILVTVCQQRPAQARGRSLGVGYREKSPPECGDRRRRIAAPDPPRRRS